MKMDTVRILKGLFVLALIADDINCDFGCDCNSVVDEQGFIKTKLNQIEYENYKIKSRLRRLETSRWHSTRPGDDVRSRESEKQINADKKEEVQDLTRIDAIEIQMKGMVSLLKISKIYDTDVKQTVVQSEVLDQIERKMSFLSETVKDINGNRDENVMRKTLVAEKRIRIRFESVVRKTIESIKQSFTEFKTESENLMHNYNDEINRKLEQWTKSVNTSVEDIKTSVSKSKTKMKKIKTKLKKTKTKMTLDLKKIINDDIQTINVSLHNSFAELLQGETGLSTDALKLTISPQLIKIRAGKTIHLRCEASANESFTIEWFRIGAQMNPSARQRHGILEIRNVTLADAGIYQCFVWNRYGNKNGYTHVEVEVPPTVIAAQRNVYALSKRTVSLKCDVSGSPLPEVRWGKVGEALTAVHSTLDGVLYIYNVQQEDAGTYICSATSSAGSARGFTTLHVVAESDTIKNVHVGDRVEMKCTVTGKPLRTITWSRDEEPLSENVTIEDGILTIPRVKLEDAGTYTCLTVNEAGFVTSKAVLSVEYK